MPALHFFFTTSSLVININLEEETLLLISVYLLAVKFKNLEKLNVLGAVRFLFNVVKLLRMF